MLSPEKQCCQCHQPFSCQQQQRPLGMLRRSISLNADTNSDDICHSQNKELRWPSKIGARPCYSRHISYQVLATGRQTSELHQHHQSNPITPYGLPGEENMGPLIRSFMGNFIGGYCRLIVLPALLFITLACTFTYLPAPPKAEIYRSLSATFVILMGITLQCCFLTGWAATQLGLADLLLLLRYYIHGLPLEM